LRWFSYNNAMAVASSEPDAGDKDFFQRLRRELEHEISGHVYGVHADGMGRPFSDDQVRALLNSMRSCLVEPHWEEVNICNTVVESSAGNGLRRRCVTMAEEDGYVLVFDPIDEEYHLAWRGEHGLGTWGVRGDGVGCFLAR
jgi:hypothetical protein